MIGLYIKPQIGIGDGLQFSSLPENYFRATGEKLIDLSRPWFFDNNPYVLRDYVRAPDRQVDLWNFPKVYEWPKPRENGQCYQSNAEIWASLLKIKVTLSRPRLYKFEDRPYESLQNILIQTHGKSHGALPQHIIDHIKKKYDHTGLLRHIGHPDDPGIGVPKLSTPTLWDLAREISMARMVIGPDSGPCWIAACYPDVISKKVRLKWQAGFKQQPEWIPLEIANHHSHWDDRAFQTYNVTDDDQGFTLSYKRL